MDGFIHNLKRHVKECAGALYEQSLTSNDGCAFAFAESVDIGVIVCISRDTWLHINKAIADSGCSFEGSGNFQTDPDQPNA